jgi:SNF2 family DNA or RNA helicase
MLDMGLGKTATTLTVAADFLDDLFVLNVLVIAPLRVCNSVWKQEAEKWEHLRDLGISICTGNAKQRSLALETYADIHIINVENIDWLVKTFNWKWDMVIIDEASKFKSHKSKRFKALKKVSKHITSMVQLTGTPSPNGLMDLWSQMYLLDNGDRLGRTITMFKSTYFYSSGYMGYAYDLRPGADKIIKHAISDICVTMKGEDYLDMPDKISIDREVFLSKDVLDLYKKFERDFIINLEEETISSPSSAALANKLLQLCNGAIYNEDGNYHVIHDEKIECLKDIISDNPNENLLVAYNFRSDLDRLKKAFPGASILSKSGAELESWNKGEIPMLLAHPASAGHGLNAQKGGSAVVWFGLNWSLELYQQFNARIYRQGQEKPVRIIHITCNQTIDKRVLEAIRNKADNQNELLKYLKVSM